MSQMILQNGRPAAVAAGTQIILAAHIAALPPGHPVRRHVVAKAMYALDVADGLKPGPYTDEAAERWARSLMRGACRAGRRRRAPAQLA
jgi:hypothetical protein